MLITSLIVAFVISVLSGLGVGGGGLFVIYLALFTDTPQLTIQGINLAFFLFSASASLIVHLTKRKIFFLAVIVMSFFGVIGALGGSVLSRYVGQDLLRKAFGIMLIFTGSFSLLKSLKRDQNE